MNDLNQWSRRTASFDHVKCYIVDASVVCADVTAAESAMATRSSQLHPMAAAVEWVSRITTVALIVVLPGFGGLWLDKQWGTSPFLGLLGFALGLTSGIWSLFKKTGATTSSSRAQLR